MKDETQYPIQLDAYRSYVNQRKADSEKYEDLMQPLESFSLHNPRVDLEYINMDSSRIARNDKWMENLQKDIYLEEALMILADLKGGTQP